MAAAVPVRDSGSTPASRLYYGWIVVFVAAAAMVGTLPGRTEGLALITQPPLAGSRVQRWGRRARWLALGCGLLAILASMSATVGRRGREAFGLVPDAGALRTSAHIRAENARALGATTGYVWADALLTPAFW